jgi:biotin carboxyl carrier protein
MKLRIAGESREYEVEVLPSEDGVISGRIDGEEWQVRTLGTFLRSDGRFVAYDTTRVSQAKRDVVFVAVGPASFIFELLPDRAITHRSRGLASPEVVAPMPGKILKILVAEGESVEAGAPLIVLEAMKMETTLFAESPATIAKLRAVPGQTVDHGALLIELTPHPPAVPSET